MYVYLYHSVQYFTTVYINLTIFCMIVTLYCYVFLQILLPLPTSSCSKTIADISILKSSNYNKQNHLNILCYTSLLTLLYVLLIKIKFYLNMLSNFCKTNDFKIQAFSYQFYYKSINQCEQSIHWSVKFKQAIFLSIKLFYQKVFDFIKWLLT